MLFPLGTQGPNSENRLFLILNMNPNIFPSLMQERIGARLHWQPGDSSEISENQLHGVRLFPSQDRAVGQRAPGLAPYGCSIPTFMGMGPSQANQTL